MSEIAIVRIRGSIGVPTVIVDTMKMLNANRKNSVTIVKTSPSLIGMLKKVEGFVTYGTISEDTKKALVDKFGERKIYNLSPPLKGFGRKGIKVAYKRGGALGDRGDAINDLIVRMIQ